MARGAAAGGLLIAVDLVCIAIGVGVAALAGASLVLGLVGGLLIGFFPGIAVVRARFKDL
jgi:hypothetical protein